jgi:2-polyprenyl-3-methyl-5-hydroxy-6-metoxy-1,4-benzoquinol methylase
MLANCGAASQKNLAFALGLIDTVGMVSSNAPQVPAIEDCWFYHVMDLPGLGTVNHFGRWDLRGRFDEYTGFIPVAGRTLVDVGSASGFLTFEAEKRGAVVTSFDVA